MRATCAGDPVAATTTLMVCDADCCGELWSNTVAMNVEIPAVVGVPERFPVGERLRPGGRTPDCSDQL